MDTNEIIGLSSSAVISVMGLIFTESIKEIIKKFFSVKSKKKINNLYWSILLLAIALPLIFVIIVPSIDKTDTKKVITEPQQNNEIKQIPNH